MKIGALIVTTGLPRVSGVAALLHEVGSVSAGQRMISAFQTAGVCRIGLVVGPEDKKGERQLAQTGVVFLRCEEHTTFFQGIQQGLSYMRDKVDRIFLVPGDTSLFLPSTLETMLKSEAPLVLPENKHVSGYPMLVDQAVADFILAQPDYVTAQEAVRTGGFSVDSIPVEDSGVLLRSDDMTYRKDLVRHHNCQLARPVTEVTLCKGGSLYDPRLSMLLHLVEETRSVRDACSLMQISYSAAWNMLNQAEEELGFPLVDRVRGGSEGSGSVMTPKGQALMEAYDRYAAHLHQEARKLYQTYFATILDTD